MEVKGHITGQAVEAFLKDGIDKEGKIVGATGAIPFIQNLNEESIERIKQQVQPIMMMDTEDMGAIKAKIQELVSKDPGALDVEPMRIEIKAGGEEEEVPRAKTTGSRGCGDQRQDQNQDSCSNCRWSTQQAPGRHLRRKDGGHCPGNDHRPGPLRHNLEDSTEWRE